MFEETIKRCQQAHLVAGDLVHIDATLVRADASLDSLARGHARQVLEQNDQADLLPGPPARARGVRNVSATPIRTRHGEVSTRGLLRADLHYVLSRPHSPSPNVTPPITGPSRKLQAYIEIRMLHTSTWWAFRKQMPQFLKELAFPGRILSAPRPVTSSSQSYSGHQI